MNERQEQTADVLGKLTVLGTIVLRMSKIHFSPLLEQSS